MDGAVLSTLPEHFLIAQLQSVLPFCTCVYPSLPCKGFCFRDVAHYKLFGQFRAIEAKWREVSVLPVLKR